MARTFERQVVELHVRVARLNRFTQLGRPTTVPVVAMAQLRLGLGSSRVAFGLCNKAGLREKIHVARYRISAKNTSAMLNQKATDSLTAWLAAAIDKQFVKLGRASTLTAKAATKVRALWRGADALPRTA